MNDVAGCQPRCTTSKSLACSMPNALLSASMFQRLSYEPLMYISEPLSATINPYFMKARKIFCTSAEKPEMFVVDLSRRRAPIGGALAFDPASCDAGYTCPFVSRTVTRNAWPISFGPYTSSYRTRPGSIANPAASAEVQPSGRRLLVFISKNAPEPAVQFVPL